MIGGYFSHEEMGIRICAFKEGLEEVKLVMDT